MDLDNSVVIARGRGVGGGGRRNGGINGDEEKYKKNYIIYSKYLLTPQ